MDEPKTLNHSKWDCKYHVVFIPKYRAVKHRYCKVSARQYSQTPRGRRNNAARQQRYRERVIYLRGMSLSPRVLGLTLVRFSGMGWCLLWTLVIISIKGRYSSWDVFTVASDSAVDI